MKKFWIVTILAISLAAGCKSQSNEKVQKAEVAQQVVKPTMLNKQMFLNYIMDYEKNPNEWNYKGELPGVVDFYADWCRPCRITSPILEELAQEYAGKIVIYKVDVQAEQELASAFGIQSIPAFLFIPLNSNPVMSAGIASTPEETKQMFRKQIDEILLKKN